MDPVIFTALCSALTAIVGAILGFIVSNRQIDTDKDNIAEQNKLLVYKVDELIKDVRSLTTTMNEYKNDIVSLNFRVTALEQKIEDLENK